MIDIGSRKVVGWALAAHMRTELVSDALGMAVAQRQPAPGTIFHSDRGCQYTSAGFATAADGLGVRLSVGRKGDCWDNAVAESFFATLKTELVDTRPWPTRAGLRRAIFEFIEGWYNTRRLHSSLGYRSPAEYEAYSSRDRRLGGIINSPTLSVKPGQVQVSHDARGRTRRQPDSATCLAVVAP